MIRVFDLVQPKHGRQPTAWHTDGKSSTLNKRKSPHHVEPPMAHHHPQICRHTLLKHVCVVCRGALLAKCPPNVGFNACFRMAHRRRSMCVPMWEHGSQFALLLACAFCVAQRRCSTHLSCVNLPKTLLLPYARWSHVRVAPTKYLSHLASTWHTKTGKPHVGAPPKTKWLTPVLKVDVWGPTKSRLHFAPTWRTEQATRVSRSCDCRPNGAKNSPGSFRSSSERKSANVTTSDIQSADLGSIRLASMLYACSPLQQMFWQRSHCPARPCRPSLFRRRPAHGSGP